jgi:hypothetical protein
LRLLSYFLLAPEHTCWDVVAPAQLDGAANQIDHDGLPAILNVSIWSVRAALRPILKKSYGGSPRKLGL